MLNPREKWDVLWSLSMAAMELCKETERLPSRPTIQEQQDAMRVWQARLRHALDRLEIREDDSVVD